MENKIVVNAKPLTFINVINIICGSLLYVLAINLFLQPLNLYPSGIPGLSQLIRSCLFSNSVIDVAGIINLIFNIPLFIIAYKSMNKKMLIGTVISLVCQTIAFSFVRVPSVALLDEKLASIMISGILGGIGCGLVLTNGGSAGGLDLLGVYFSKKFEHFSVGKLSIIFNIFLYSLCAYVFDIRTAIYSFLFVVFFSVAIDRFHYQNIEVELMIFTHHDEIVPIILNKYVRGVTSWSGQGAYTNTDTHVYVTVVAKSEVESVKKDIINIDPKAFIIVKDHVSVLGGYQKRLDI